MFTRGPAEDNCPVVSVQCDDDKVLAAYEVMYVCMYA